MTALMPEDDEFTELRDADIDRMDGVGKGANGTRWFIAKSAGGETGPNLFSSEFVRDLIAKGDGDGEYEAAVKAAGQSLTLAQTYGWTPAQIGTLTPVQRAMALVHAASVRKAEATGYAQLVKAKYDADQLRALGAKGHAMSLGGGQYDYPIADDQDLTRAIRAVGRGGTDHDKIRRYIARRAREMGRAVPDNWNADGSLKESAVAKADDMDPTAVLAEPDGDAPGDPDAPGTPAWEAVDAAAARKWTGILVRAKNAIRALSEREGMEAATGDSDELMDVLALEDAACHVDSAIGILARFAVDEQAASDLGGEDMAAVGKAMSGFDVAALETLEGFAPVVKAGRVLSAANEAAIRAACDALAKVLASLPAPIPDDGQVVAKTMKEIPVSQAAAPVDETDVQAPEPVAKADKKPMFVVCDDSGRPVGVCDPDDIMPIAGGPGGGDKASAAPAADGDGGDAAVIPGTDTVASPAMTAGGATVAKTTTGTTEQPAAKTGKSKKGKKRDKLAKQLKEVLDPIAGELARGAQLADVVKSLEQRVARIAAAPDDRKSPLFNGATGDGAGLVVRDGLSVDPLADLKKAVDDAPDEVAKAAARQDLGVAAIKARFAGRI